ncbi:MAG: hypothetical protein Q9165_007980 [Trypethelium subeluteriae]
MFKKQESPAGEHEAEVLQQLSHHNIVKIKQLYLDEKIWYLGLEHYQFTLEEVLNVHLNLEEPHVQVISKAPQHRTIASVREQRTLNKVFGLNEPARWSGAKQLIDFIEELIDPDKSARHKIEKPMNTHSSNSSNYYSSLQSAGQNPSPPAPPRSGPPPAPATRFHQSSQGRGHRPAPHINSFTGRPNANRPHYTSPNQAPHNPAILGPNLSYGASNVPPETHWSPPEMPMDENLLSLNNTLPQPDVGTMIGLPFRAKALEDALEDLKR